MSKMNNIDDLVNKAFEDFEMSYDASQWDLLQNKMDQMNVENSFDKTVKSKLENHQVGYEPAAWTAVESQLAGSTVSYTKWIVAAGVVGLVSLGAFFLFNSDDVKVETNSNSTQKTELAKTKVDKKNQPEIQKAESVNEHENTTLNNSIKAKPEVNNNITNNVNQTSNSTIPANNSNGTPNGNSTVVNNVNIPQTSDNSSAYSGDLMWQLPVPKITGVTEICEGTEVNFTSSDFTKDVNIAWKLNGVEVGSEKEISLVNLTPGQHEIELVHSANKNIETCSEPVVSTKVLVTVKETPKIDFSYKQIGDAYYPETKFETLSESEFDNLIWTIDGKNFAGEEAVYIFNKKGNYPVTLEASFENGCKFKESKNIEINNDYNLLAPIAFTPNADGLNDEFIPEALKVLNLPFKMTIYDRSQGYVYQTSRVDAAWTGRNLNTNEICGQGSYLWVVELTNKKGETEIYSGTITLLK